MYYGNIKNCDVADGLGVRVSLFVSGCRNHCKGCFNEQTWDFHYGDLYTKEVEDYIIDLLKPDYIDGFTLLGGEPFEEENQETVCNLLKRIKQTYPSKSIWCYTGYVLDQDILPKDGRKHTKFTDEILSCIDVLVDGPFIESKRNLMLEYRGSENQRLIDLPSTLKEKRIIPYIVKQTSMD